MGKRIQSRKIKMILLTVSVCLMLSGIMAYLVLDGWFLDQWNEKEMTPDLNGDGINEVITLKNRGVTVYSGKEGESIPEDVLWKSDKKWKVCDFLVTDIDGDTMSELLILLWKRGSFEKYKPMWEEDTRDYTQHIFIYKYGDGMLKPVWKSSQLRPKVAQWELLDRNRIRIITHNKTDTVWKYGEWGLERIQ
ncbi:MAG: hypothetical protein ACI4AQ_00330 [Lachnospiraceae bacterium]